MKIIECPRDAMQGLERFIPTADKVAYINQLMKVGFDTLDAGSFVSPKAIPQMRDTAEVLSRIERVNSNTELLMIVANLRGAEEALAFESVRYVGFPLSISETFQKRNTNRSIAEALDVVNDIQELCHKKNRTQVVYVSMGFGNPYGDPYTLDLVDGFLDLLSTLKVPIVSLSDTIGVAKPSEVTHLYSSLAFRYPHIELGLHMHSKAASAEAKIEAAFSAGCRRIDGALKGFGGCPLAEDELVGNIPTEEIIRVLDKHSATPNINRDALSIAMRLADKILGTS